MAKVLKIDSLRYLSAKDVAECIGIDTDRLCTGCITGRYPTEWGGKHFRRAKGQFRRGNEGARTYE
jgi:glutamine phosphoribosylpyrophosphate amidotransferase